MARNIQLYLKRSLWKAKIFDIPCYIDEAILEKSLELIRKFGNRAFSTLYPKKNYHLKIENCTAGYIQTLAAFQMEKCEGMTHVKTWVALNFWAAEQGNFEMVKVISPLMENPNATMLWTKYGGAFTTINAAAKNGHLEIVKFLVPLSNNLDAKALREIFRNFINNPHINAEYLRSILKSIEKLQQQY